MTPFRTAVDVSLLVGFALLASACQPGGPEALWQDYLQRLERLADLRAEPAPPISATRYPRSRDVRQPIPELRTGMRRYFGLAQCDMMGLVSARNSSLGRLQTASLRFAYELDFIRQAETCLIEDRLAEREDLDAWLTEISRLKRESLPALYWNATLGSQEMASFFTTTARPADAGTLADLTTVETLFDRMALTASQLTGDTLPADVGVLEQDIAHLAHSDTGGRILQGLALATGELQRSASLLEQVDTARLCPDQRPSEQARYFNNVFTAVYGERVQPWLADLDRANRRLVQAVARLADALPADSPAFDAWHHRHLDPDGPLQQAWHAAMQRHTRAWQHLLGDCGMPPGAHPAPSG
ncbi:DUF3080 family protein [Isoalcanivorax indicus]|uniref:DUF3080 family protein n=1 Tax=Isoalcanivorax indicus TaxID=2202653 RepID=UPI000DB9B148|nr:DUF3080 family protein [Isoalcanivorax indicus]